MPCAGDELVFVAWPHQPLNSPGLSGRLGIVYCVNRACALHSISMPKKVSSDAEKIEVDAPFLAWESICVILIVHGPSVMPDLERAEKWISRPYVDVMQEPFSRCLTPTLTSALSPRFTPDTKRILFLSHSAAASSGVHNATATLCSLPWPSQPLHIPLSLLLALAITPRPLDNSRPL